jgi:hypothetical protein
MPISVPLLVGAYSYRISINLDTGKTQEGPGGKPAGALPRKETLMSDTSA